MIIKPTGIMRISGRQFDQIKLGVQPKPDDPRISNGTVKEFFDTAAESIEVEEKPFHPPIHANGNAGSMVKYKKVGE